MNPYSPELLHSAAVQCYYIGFGLLAASLFLYYLIKSTLNRMKRLNLEIEGTLGNISFLIFCLSIFVLAIIGANYLLNPTYHAFKLLQP